MEEQHLSKGQRTRERILKAASARIRSHGLAGTGVADVMKAAGLTHGGFYAHFASREEMLGAALDGASVRSARKLRGYAEGAKSDQGLDPFRELLTNYLSERHAQLRDAGCPVAAIASELTRQGDPLQMVGKAAADRLVAEVKRSLPAHSAHLAISIVAQMLGGLHLARIYPAPQRRKILAQVREAIFAQLGER